MTAPLPVEVVRPYADTGTLIGRTLGALAEFFIAGYLVMIAAGNVFGWHQVGYWKATLLVLGVRALQRPLTQLDHWSRRAKKATR